MAEQRYSAAWLQRHPRLVLLLLLAIGTLRIVSTYDVFSQTSDEPAHIATGMQWLDQGRYDYEPLHPPLARVATAVGPYLDGRRALQQPDMWREGNAILGEEPAYTRTLALARLGVLPFFWLACVVVWLWGRLYFDEKVAALATLIFSLLPPVLAHAGMATTDMALTATCGAAFLAAARWAERPSLRASLLLGLCLGLALLSKFSALAFLPVALSVAALAWLLWQRPKLATLAGLVRARLGGAALAAASALLLVWAGYRFSYGPVPGLAWPVPAPELILGIRQLLNLNHIGPAVSYLLGQHGSSGWWYYYLVVLAVKTPLAMLALLALGLTLAARRPGWWLALALSGGILLFCCAFSRINLGVRHILPVYLGFSILAAAGVQALLESGRRAAGALAAALLLGLCASSALAHPDYLAYFNPLAGSHPERILVDSDLDWGQDMKRLAVRLRQLGATQVRFTPCMSVGPGAFGMPPQTPNDFLRPAPGWNAVRLTYYELLKADQQVEHPKLRFWEDAVPPTERIGKGILLWYFPDDLPAPPAWLPTAHVYCPDGPR